MQYLDHFIGHLDDFNFGFAITMMVRWCFSILLSMTLIIKNKSKVNQYVDKLIKNAQNNILYYLLAILKRTALNIIFESIKNVNG